MKTPKFIQILICIIVNCTIMYFYGIVLGYPLRFDKVLFIFFFGGLFSAGFCSMIRNPTKFLEAGRERLVRPFALLLILGVKVFRFCISILLRMIKLIFALFIAVVYGISPIDFIPEFFFGIGFIDDTIVVVYAFYWGLTLGRWGISSSIKEFENNLNLTTKIKTSFP